MFRSLGNFEILKNHKKVNEFDNCKQNILSLKKRKRFASVYVFKPT